MQRTNGNCTVNCKIWLLWVNMAWQTNTQPFRFVHLQYVNTGLLRKMYGKCKEQTTTVLLTAKFDYWVNMANQHSTGRGMWCGDDWCANMFGELIIWECQSEQNHLLNNRRDLHSFNFKYKWSNSKMSTFSLTNYKVQSQKSAIHIYTGWTVNGSTPLKRYIKFLKAQIVLTPKLLQFQSLQCILRELASISALSNAKSIFSPGFSHVRKKYNVFSINFETES